MFKLEIDTSNAAFEDENTGSTNVAELVYILEQAASKVVRVYAGALYDSNGNVVGHFELS